MMALR